MCPDIRSMFSVLCRVWGVLHDCLLPVVMQLLEGHSDTLRSDRLSVQIRSHSALMGDPQHTPHSRWKTFLGCPHVIQASQTLLRFPGAPPRVPVPPHLHGIPALETAALTG